MTSLSMLLRVSSSDAATLGRTIRSVRAQKPADWELILIREVPRSKLPGPVQKLVDTDMRLRVVDATATRPPEWAGVDEALGDFVATIEAGSTLSPTAVRTLLAAASHEDVDVVYSDVAHVNKDGEQLKVWRKPAWSPERLRAQPYLVGLVAYRRTALRALGEFGSRDQHELDYEMALRMGEVARRVAHVPEPLLRAGWSNKPARHELPPAAVNLVQEHLDRMGLEARAELGPNKRTVRLRRAVPDGTRVSVIIPTIGATGTVRGEQRPLVVQCVESVMAATASVDAEVVVVYDPPTPESVLDELRRIAGNRLNLVRFDEPFNFSRKCNQGALHATGSVLVFLNDDTEGRDTDWLGELVAPLSEQSVGATGAKLYFEDSRLQHVGHAYGHGTWMHPYYGANEDSGVDDHDEFSVNREVSGVTAAAMAVRRDVFETVGGFCERLPNNYNDVDFCNKVRLKGYRILWMANARLFHYESISRDPVIERRETEFAVARWGVPKRDEYLASFVPRRRAKAGKTRRRRIPRVPLSLAAPVLVFLLLSLLGVTTSSIGSEALRRDADHPHGITWGEPQDIRSDEYVTDSPVTLGRITAGLEGTGNPLSVPNGYFHQFPTGPVTSVVFFEGTLSELLGPWLPDAMLFAAKWWLPTLLLFIGVPLWFAQVTRKRKWGYLAAALIYFSPANAWWSGRPVDTLGFMFAACALLIAAHSQLERGRRARAVGLALISAVLMARFPSYYQPWAIVLGFPVLIATSLFILTRKGTRSAKWTILALAGVAGAVLTGLSLYENLDAIRAGLNTVYPGQRRESANPMTLTRMFAAAALGGLEGSQGRFVGTNASETSSSFTVLLIATAVLLPAGWRAIRRPGRWVLGTFVAASAFWVLWCTVTLGNLSHLGGAVPVLSLVPPSRAAQVVGFLAIIAFCLLLALWKGEGSFGHAAVAGILVAWLTFYAGSMMRITDVPLTPGWAIAAGGLGAGICVFALAANPSARLPFVLTVIAVVFLTGFVNPIQVGLGDLRGTPASNYLIKQGRAARADGTVWASDSRNVDALLAATGTPSLSSRQLIGPNVAEWSRLDPRHQHMDMWNRGGTHIRFEWTDARQLTWELPDPDKVLMSASPCTVARAIPELRHIVSSDDLHSDCLRFERRLRFGGENNYVYAIKPQVHGKRSTRSA